MTSRLDRLLNATPEIVQKYLIVMPRVEVVLHQRDYEMLERVEPHNLRSFEDEVLSQDAVFSVTREYVPYHRFHRIGRDGVKHTLNLAVSPDIANMLGYNISRLQELDRETNALKTIIRKQDNEIVQLKSRVYNYESESLWDFLKRWWRRK